MTLSADTLVTKSLELVSPPSTYAQLSTLIQQANTSADDISEVINTDPALTTRLLKIVNSPYYGFPSQINTIPRAITIVGTKELIQLVLATSVINAFKGIPGSLINLDEFWRHSLACALTAKHIAKRCKLPATEQFFTSGLLHNIGCLVMYQSMPELAREAINAAQFGQELIYQAERRIFGFDHTEVGEALIRKWRLPESLIEPARLHHSPELAVNDPLHVAIIHVADIMVTATGEFGHSGDHHVPPLNPVAWEQLQLPADVIPEILHDVAQQLDALTASLQS
ncbi:MAG: HDOD domain-containing protein [Gammaproteobacteria bacterium]|nr:HDOD domain-containing protein [Gammaproteobacteria bacterium]